jgi:hypothetical protein
MRKLLIFALFAACTVGVISQKMSAQRAGSGYSHFPNTMPAHGPGGTNPGGASSNFASRPDFASLRRLYRGGPYGDLLSSFGIFSDSPGASPSYGNSAAAPNFFLMPSLLSSELREERPQPATQPLMIELRGDRYVRVANDGENAENALAPANQPASHETRGSASVNRTAPSVIVSNIKSTSASELPPTVLIFRDGHSENVQDYAITDGVIYARGNYYTDGYWNKKIEVSSLNVPQTIQSNEARGVQFHLPGAPNEVITRP